MVSALDLPLTWSSRRDFLRLSGLGGAGVLLTALATACDESLTDPTASPPLDFKSNNGVLNYAYALNQLQTDFYYRAVGEPFPGITAVEFATLSDIRSHEFSKRRLFREAILGGRISDVLRFNFDEVVFSNRASVMTTARLLEDLTVAALNGAARFATDPVTLLLIAKIASVDARHAATLRDLISLANAGSDAAAFAGNDIVDASTGTDQAKDPRDVLAEIERFFQTALTTSGLPEAST